MNVYLAGFTVKYTPKKPQASISAVHSLVARLHTCQLYVDLFQYKNVSVMHEESLGMRLGR